MPVDTAIAQALFEVVDTISPAQDIAWPGVKFDPPAEGYLKVSLLSAEPNAVSVDFAGSNQHQGILQVDVFRPKETSEIEMRGVAEMIIAHFPRGLRIFESGFVIDISEPPMVGPLLAEEAYLMLPVRIRWRCFAANP